MIALTVHKGHYSCSVKSGSEEANQDHELRGYYSMIQTRVDDDCTGQCRWKKIRGKIEIGDTGGSSRGSGYSQGDCVHQILGLSSCSIL